MFSNVVVRKLAERNRDPISSDRQIRKHIFARTSGGCGELLTRREVDRFDARSVHGGAGGVRHRTRQVTADGLTLRDAGV